MSVLSASVILAQHARRPLHSSPNLHGIISFADARPFTTIKSYRYKKIGRRGRVAAHGVLPTLALSPLAATLTELPASVASKRLTAWLNSLDATYKKPGVPSLKPKAFSSASISSMFGRSDERMSTPSKKLPGVSILFPFWNSSAIESLPLPVCYHRRC